MQFECQDRFVISRIKQCGQEKQFINENQMDPRLSDLEDATGIPADEILYALDAIQDPMSLHEPMNGGDGDPVLFDGPTTR